MNIERSSEPPDEPYIQREVALLSPASPKPLHFPTPTNIPILEMQNDVDFNQTEPHMADPAMRNTAVRPDIWRDPNEQEDENASPYSTGGEATGVSDEIAAPEAAERENDGGVADSANTAANTVADPEPAQASNEASHQSNATVDVASAPDAVPADATLSEPEPTVPADEASATNDATTSAAPPEPASEPFTNAFTFDSNVNVQALLDTLQIPQPQATPSGTNGVSAAPPATQANDQTQSQSVGPSHEVTAGSPPSSAVGAAPPSGLPPRPPPQEQPLMNPNYAPSHHIRDYHPHAANSAFLPHQGQQHQRNGSESNAAGYAPAVQASSATASTPQQQQAQTYLHNQATQHSQQSPTNVYPGSALGYQTGASAAPTSTSGTPIESRRETKLAAGEIPTAEDRPWDAEIQAKYDRFIEAERGYVLEGRWEQFPMGSRLFVGMRSLSGAKLRRDEVGLVDDDHELDVRTRSADGSSLLTGNLSSEKVTKRDIFHVFWRYGDLAQISIKQAYGFVQFLTAEECRRALEGEQGRQIRDKRIHLEISKPQKNRAGVQNPGRRSRSPDYRGKSGPAQDRFGSSYGGRQQGRGYGQGYRSPSPPRGYRDRPYRDRSPDYGRGRRYRSPTPPRRSEDDDLPLPRRAPRDVPDVQILVVDNLDREFISWVERAFSGRGIKVDVLLLSPRLDEQAVIRRQIVEGVQAVVRLGRSEQNSGKIGVRVFDRSAGGGVGSVQFEEYQGLDPPIAVELVLRAKQKAAAAPPASYGNYSGQQGYGGASYGGQQPAYGQALPNYPPQPGYAPPSALSQQQQPPQQNLQNLITSLDPNGLQSLLSAMGTPATPQAGAYGTPQSAGAYGTPQQQQAAMAALQQNPQMAAGLQQAAAQPPQSGGAGGQVNMQDILAKLGRYK